MFRVIYLLFSFLFAGMPSFAMAKSMAKPPNFSEPNSLAKLVAFSVVCDVKQISNLLRQDPKFNINEGFSTITPLQLAQTRLVRSIKEGDGAIQTACYETIATIMKDPRYMWKESIIGRMTDLMYLLEATKDLTVLQSKNIELGKILGILQQRSDFDINYQTQGATGSDRPRTVAGVIAEGGNIEIWCSVRKVSPGMKDGMDNRANGNQYTPLLLAAAAGKGDMVRLLIGEGADWMITLQNINDPWPIALLARNSGDATLEAWLIKHKQGNAHVEGCTN